MSINPSEYIAIPRDQVPTAIKKVYELSSPRGLGFLHAKEGELEDEVIQRLMTQFDKQPNYPVLVSMDYVYGRCCKMTIRRHPTDDSLALLPTHWYDHLDYQLLELMEACGVEEPAASLLAAREVRDQRLAAEEITDV